MVKLRSGFREYLRRIRMFSFNAKVFLLSSTLHGLSYGVWITAFNLYLLELGFKDDFVAIMFSLNTFAIGFAAFPAGLLCEKIGTKRSLIIGILFSNLFNLIQIFTLQPPLLLSASLLAGIFSAISWVAGDPLLTENSQKEERTHLFSMNWTLGMASSVLGSLLAGFLPRLFASLFRGSGQNAFGFQMTLFSSVALTLVSLMPLFAIKEKTRLRQTTRTVLSLKNIKNWPIISKLAITTGLIGLGAGFIVPFFNVFFEKKLLATTEEIGVLYALGAVTMATGTLLAPVLSSRVGKVNAICLTQFCSVPFISAIALANNIPISGFSYLMRGALMNMAGPIGGTFTMEAVEPRERATTSGLLTMADNVLRASTAILAGQMMSSGDYVLPYHFTSALYLTASTLYFVFFRKIEKAKVERTPQA